MIFLTPSRIKQVWMLSGRMIKIVVSAFIVGGLSNEKNQDTLPEDGVLNTFKLPKDS